MFTFRPAIFRNGQLTELPRPVTSLRIQDSWDFARFKVPLKDGSFTAGHSRNGVDISLEGQIGSVAGAVKLSEEAMFGALESLRSALDANGATDRYRFFVYHDVSSGTYRSFGDCCTVRFEYDLSHPSLFTYSVLIHASDAALSTAPPV